MNAYPICLGVILNDLGGAPSGISPSLSLNFFGATMKISAAAHIRQHPRKAVMTIPGIRVLSRAKTPVIRNAVIHIATITVYLIRSEICAL